MPELLASILVAALCVVVIGLSLTPLLARRSPAGDPREAAKRALAGWAVVLAAGLAIVLIARSQLLR